MSWGLLLPSARLTQGRRSLEQSAASWTAWRCTSGSFTRIFAPVALKRCALSPSCILGCSVGGLVEGVRHGGGATERDVELREATFGWSHSRFCWLSRGVWWLNSTIIKAWRVRISYSKLFRPLSGVRVRSYTIRKWGSRITKNAQNVLVY